MADDKDNRTVAQRAFGPAAEEFGKEIAPVGKDLGIVTAKVGRMLVSGLEKSVYGLEQIGAWIQKRVSERLKDVPPDQIVEPDARIAVPATQALIYSMNDELIREMFASLLAADMNAATKEKVHPAFVEMIRQMTRPDAEVLKVIKARPEVEFLARLQFYLPQRGFKEVGLGFSFEISDHGDLKVTRAISNLKRLEIVESRRDEWPMRDDLGDLEEKFRAHFRDFVTRINTSDETKRNMGIVGNVNLFVEKTGLYLTPLGVDFANICIPG